jgi:membrane associated rhomboid family serine protease
VSSETETPAGVCYRHPNRQSWVLCQRCGRTICPSCQTQAAVGVHCPECVREGRASLPRRSRGVLRAALAPGSAPVVTYVFTGITVVVFLLQQVTSGAVTQAGIYAPAFTAVEPWRMITSIFLHGGLLHVGLNMLSLLFVGRALEPLLGRSRFLALYLFSGFAGSVAVLLLGNAFTGVLGASGAIFGLLGAFLIIGRRMGANITPMIVLVGINLVLGFVVPGISWQAHVGGLIGGALVALVYLRTRRSTQRTVQIALLAGLGAALILIAVVAYAFRVGLVG